jgi:hypothetical protein
MKDDEPTIPHQTLPARPVSSGLSWPSVAGSSGGADAAPPPRPQSSSDRSTSVARARHARWPTVRRPLWNRKRGWIVAAALLCVAIGLSVALATSPSATSANFAPGGGFAGGLGSGSGGSNARSAPASEGASGTVGSVSTSGFTISTSAGQQVTVDEASSTTYQNGSSPTSASAVTPGEPVLVLGTTSGTTITATQVIVQPTGGLGSSASSSSGVVPFQRGAPTTSKQVGQIPSTYRQGSGTIVGGTTANTATEAALAAYPGGIVDRVVKLSDGGYEVHYIGVNWPHHIFVNKDFEVVGAG